MDKKRELKVKDLLTPESIEKASQESKRVFLDSAKGKDLTVLSKWSGGKLTLQRKIDSYNEQIEDTKLLIDWWGPFQPVDDSYKNLITDLEAKRDHKIEQLEKLE